MAVKACSILGGAISEHQGEQKLQREFADKRISIQWTDKPFFFFFLSQVLQQRPRNPRWGALPVHPSVLLCSVLFRCNAPAQKRRHNKKFGRPKFQLKRPLKTVLLVMFGGVPQKSTTSWSNLFKKKKAKVVTKPVVILTTFYSTKW